MSDNDNYPTGYKGPKIGNTYPTSQGIPYVDIETGKKGVVINWPIV